MAGGTTLSGNLYSNNNANNISSWTTQTAQRAYTYDAVDRLTGVSNFEMPSENYSYDAVGNRTASHLSPATATSHSTDWSQRHPRPTASTRTEISFRRLTQAARQLTRGISRTDSNRSRCRMVTSSRTNTMRWDGELRELQACYRLFLSPTTTRFTYDGAISHSTS